jgi:hypothetical protein
MNLLNDIIRQTEHLEEYEKKQLAIILISKTLTNKTTKDTFKIIKQHK